MKHVYWRTIYNDFFSNGLFDESKCLLGQNLMIPNIKLKQALMKDNIELSTFDTHDGDVDFLVVNDIVSDSLYTCSTLKDFIAYFLKKKYKNDAIKYLKKHKVNNLLLLSEPLVVCPKSYQTKYHKFFDKIMTWNDDLVDNVKYIKYFIPQVTPSRDYFVDFKNKRMLVMMSSNKTTSQPGELYSKRIQMMESCLNKKMEFDLYGYGWNPEKYACYKGTVKDKLDVISNYKFAICFENYSANGYITEKIFDCFFANVVPIYYGAPNITDYIPKDLFINYLDFKNDDELLSYISNISESEYTKMLKSIKDFLLSKKFKDTFSYENYVNKMKEIIVGGIE